MNIHQIKMSYSSREDRLIMSINSDNNKEIRLFLTQRIMTSFWDILNQAINHSFANQSVFNDKSKSIPIKPIVKFGKQSTHQQMEQQTQQNIDNESDDDIPFNADNKFPIGKKPILVEKITINTYKNDNITLIFTDATEKNITLSFDSKLLHNIFNLLIKIIPSTGWNVELSDKTNSLIPKKENKLVLH